MVDDEPFNF